MYSNLTQIDSYKAFYRSEHSFVHKWARAACAGSGRKGRRQLGREVAERAAQGRSNAVWIPRLSAER